MTLALLILAPSLIFAVGYALGRACGAEAKARDLAAWVERERRERIAADRATRHAEAREREAMRRLGEQVRGDRLSRMFGQSGRN